MEQKLGEKCDKRLKACFRKTKFAFINERVIGTKIFKNVLRLR
jgi:hypothetical protein